MFASRLTSLHARLAARLARTLAVAGIAAATLTSAACATDSVTAPQQAPASATVAHNHDLLGTVTGTLTTTTNTLTTTTRNVLTQVTGLTWSKSVSATTVSKVIGPDGGSFSIANGIKVIVPKGAVKTNTNFSVTRLAGNAVAYDFQPHGTVFAVPVQIEQPTLGTNLFKWSPSTSIRGAYFPDQSLLNTLTGVAYVSEFRPTIVSADKAWIKFTVDHFSGYMVSVD